MGKYTDNLFKKNRLKPNKPYKFTLEEDESDKEFPRLISVAIIRDGVLHKGFQSHAELRRSLRDENPYISNPRDEEGFYTSDERFVTRDEAKQIAVDAGQLPASMRVMERDFLSSDIW